MEFDIYDRNFDERVNKYVGEKIKFYRQRKKISQDGLGKLIGVGNGAVSKYELGKSSIALPTIFKIAEILEVNVNDLFPPIGQETDRKSEALNVVEKLDTEVQDALINLARIVDKVSR